GRRGLHHRAEHSRRRRDRQGALSVAIDERAAARAARCARLQTRTNQTNPGYIRPFKWATPRDAGAPD
ncbi:hypothetical protein, partial [Escherichia coli]|uniref:hypothetical protein n=1 Tax=Escherichia coli TaxID=562 RepID=UPI0019D5B576